MKDYKKSVKVTLALTYILMIALAVLIVTLPYLAMWYVEKKNRPDDLAIVSMLTCYPCVPFATVALFSLKNLLKNILKGNIVCEKNLNYLKRLGFCCLVAGVIMLIAGFFYKPFFVSSGSALFCSLVVKVIYDVIEFYIEKENKEEKD